MTKRGRDILFISFLIGFAVIVGSVAKYPNHFSSKKAYEKQGIMSPLQIELRDWTQVGSLVSVSYVLTNKGSEVVIGWTMEYLYVYMNTQNKQVVQHLKVYHQGNRRVDSREEYFGVFVFTEHREVVEIKIWGVTEAVLE